MSGLHYRKDGGLDMRFKSSKAAMASGNSPSPNFGMSSDFSPSPNFGMFSPFQAQPTIYPDEIKRE